MTSIDEHICGEHSPRLYVCLACESYERLSVVPYLDQEEFRTLVSRAGRKHGPGLLLEAYVHNLIDESIVAAEVGPIWCMSEYPDRALEWPAWRELFDIAGYTVDGRPATRPAAEVILYRAAPPSHRLGHSWTESPALARSFAALGARSLFAPRLWVATVEPWRVLARLSDVRAGEVQYVVETEGLEVCEVSPEYHEAENG